MLKNILLKYKKIKNQLDTPDVIPDFLNSKYIPSLDGWRAIAILIVILGHFMLTLPKGNMLQLALRVTVYSNLGVKIFFVLSGFLITTLLIKEKIKTGKVNIIHFFIRRILRIFPVLYLYLLIVYIINIVFDLKLISDHFIAPLLYIRNFNFLQGTWITGHTWSLAVEEQFYLLWPFLFSISKNIILICISIILVTPIIDIIVYLHPEYALPLLYPFFSPASSIFTGALMSLLLFKVSIYEKLTTSNLFKLKYPFIAAILIYIIFLTSSFRLLSLVVLPFGTITINICISYLILFSILNKETVIFRFLNSNILVKIGIISYSLYIWQQLFIIPTGNYPNLEQYIFFPLNIVLTFFAAYLSYHYFEKPILKLKTRFSSL